MTTRDTLLLLGWLLLATPTVTFCSWIIVTQTIRWWRHR